MEALELLTLTNANFTPLFTDTCAEIYHISEVNVVCMRVRGLTKNQCYQANSERALAYLVALKSTKLLIDLRELMMMDTHDRCWTEDIWQTEIAETGLKKMAIIMPESLFAILSVNKIVENIKKNTRWETEVFTEEKQVSHWLIKI